MQMKPREINSNREDSRSEGEQSYIWLAGQCDILTGEAFVLAEPCSSQQEN